METWTINEKGQHVFSGGRESHELASRTATECPKFLLDVDEELVAEEEISCYNCRYRRWTEESFICMKR
jgi:hypothetical protein